MNTPQTSCNRYVEQFGRSKDVSHVRENSTEPQAIVEDTGIGENAMVVSALVNIGNASYLEPERPQSRAFPSPLPDLPGPSLLLTQLPLTSLRNLMTRSKTTTVLLIDPNKDDRQHWTKRLKSSSPHYKVFAAKDAETGLAVCQSERIDCVVMELHLPDMSGFQVLLLLNPIIYRSLQTPVVALSNFTDPSIAEAAKQLGAQSYLIKSQASGDDLHRAIQTAILRVELTRKEAYKLKTETHFAEKSAA